MSSSAIGVISGVFSVIALLALVGLLVLVGVRASGRPRLLAMIGLGLLLLGRLLVTIVLPVLYDLISSSASTFGVYIIVQNLVGVATDLVGIGLVVFAVITATRAAPGTSGPAQPGPAGWTPQQPGPYPTS